MPPLAVHPLSPTVARPLRGRRFTTGEFLSKDSSSSRTTSNSSDTDSKNDNKSNCNSSNMVVSVQDGQETMLLGDESIHSIASEQQTPATSTQSRGRGQRGRGVERKRSSSLSAMNRRGRGLQKEGSFASIKAKYLDAAKETNEKGIYSRAALTQVGQIDEDTKTETSRRMRKKLPARTRSSSLTQLDQRKGLVRRAGRKKQQAEKQQQQKLQQPPPLEKSPTVALKKTWASQSSVESRKKVPQRTRSKSLTQLDQRNRRATIRSSWKQREEEDNFNWPEFARIAQQRNQRRQTWVAAAKPDTGSATVNSEKEESSAACTVQAPVSAKTEAKSGQKQQEPTQDNSSNNNNDRFDWPEFAQVAHKHKQRRQTWVASSSSSPTTERAPGKEKETAKSVVETVTPKQVTRKDWSKPKVDDQTPSNLPDIARVASNRRASVGMAPQNRRQKPQRTRSRSLTQLDQRRRTATRRPQVPEQQQEEKSFDWPEFAKLAHQHKQRRQTWVAAPPTTPTQQQQQQPKDEGDSTAKVDSPTLTRKSLRKPLQPAKHQQPADVTTAEAEVAARPSRTGRKAPARTRSRSLTAMDQRTSKNDATKTSAKRSWKRRPSLVTTNKPKEEEEKDPTSNLPDIARIGARRTSVSVSNPQSYIASRRNWLKANKQHQDDEDSKKMVEPDTTPDIARIGARRSSVSVSSPQSYIAARRSWLKQRPQDFQEPEKVEPDNTTESAPTPAEDEKKEEDNADRESLVATTRRGRDSTPREESAEEIAAKAPAPPRRQRPPVQRGVARTRSRSLTSLRKEKASDGTVTRTYLDYYRKNKWIPLKERSATKIQTRARGFLVRLRLLRATNATKIQTVARGFLMRLRWITRKPWLQKRKILREKESELQRIARQKESDMNGIKFDLQDEEREIEQKLKALYKEKSSLEKQVQIEKETKNTIRDGIRKEKEEEERHMERRRTESAITVLQSSAVTGVHVQQAGSKKRIKAYKKEMKAIRKELKAVDEMWEKEKDLKRRIDRCVRSIVRALREDPDEENLADFIAKYSGVDV